MDAFVLTPNKQGRVKYLLLTLGPSFLISRISLALTQRGMLPATDLTGICVMLFSMAVTFTLGYFMILRKNHTVEVGSLSVAEKNWQGKCRVIPRGKIRAYRRNWLGETLLLEEGGKTLLCIESNMENLDRLMAWLDSYEIKEK